jgi:ribose transport system permease protein
VTLRRAGSTATRLERARELGIVIALILLAIVLSVSSSSFLSFTNFTNILDQWAPIGIMACAGTLVVIGGNFDLSIGAIFGAAGVTAAKVANSTSSWELGMAAGLGIAMGFGLMNAILVTVFRVNSFIATLASSLVIGGFADALSGGFLIPVEDPGFQSLGTKTPLDIPLSVYAFAVVILLSGFALSATVFGRHVYGAGNNPEAARLSGVRVELTRAWTFILSGLSAGIAGLIVASRSGTGQANAGDGLEFTTITAIILGGTSIFGGEGAIWRTVAGVLLLALIGNGFNLLNVSSTYQMMIQGGIIVTAVAFDAWARSRE